MKKLINKIKGGKNDDNQAPASRITSDTVAEHREKVLAGGRRFKYPIQYAKHKLVYNAIIISVAAIIIAVVIGWWQLYPMQNTSEFMYRVTKVLPLPVAYVDGQPVLYSDYLMIYRSSIHFEQTQTKQLNPKTEDGKRQINHIKQESMKEAIADAYAVKLSKTLGVTVSDDEIDAAIKEIRQLNEGEVSQRTYDASILSSLGWTPDENRHSIKKGILRRKVTRKIDKDALETIGRVDDIVRKDNKTDFKTLATKLTNNDSKVIYGRSGWVPISNQDGGLSRGASVLKKGETSSIIKSWDNGYYIVRLIGSNDKKVNYEYVQVPLTAFNRSLIQIIESDKVQKLISIEDK